MNDLGNIPISFSRISNNNLISLLLYGDDNFDDAKNRKILIQTVRFIINSHRFDGQIL